MITFLIILGWLVCSVISYIFGKFLWIKDMKSVFTTIPVWSQETRLTIICFSLIFGPFGLCSLLLISSYSLLAYLLKFVGYSPDKPAKW